MALDAWGWVAIVVLLVALALRNGIGGRRGKNDRGDLSGVDPSRMPPSSSAAPPPAAASAKAAALGLTTEHLAEIERQLKAGNKITAVKLMREATGMGLAEAKDAVEAMER